MRTAKDARQCVLIKQKIDLERVVNIDIEDAIEDNCFKVNVNTTNYEKEAEFHICKLCEEKGYSVTRVDEQGDRYIVIEF